MAGIAAEQYILEQLGIVRAVREQVKNPKDVVGAVTAIIAENAESRKRLERLEAKQLAVLSKELATRCTLVGGVRFVGEVVEVSGPDALKKVCFDLKPLLEGPFVVVLAAAIEGKASVVLMIEESLVTTKGWEAAKLIRERVAPLIGGGGGGQKTLATAGGQDAGRLEAVIGAIREAPIQWFNKSPAHGLRGAFQKFISPKFFVLRKFSYIWASTIILSCKCPL